MSKQLRKWMAKELCHELQDVDCFVLFGYRGVNAEQAHEFRSKMLEDDVKIKVLKNTIADVSFQQIYGEDFKEMLQGPMAMAYGTSPAEIAKALSDWGKKKKLIAIKGGYLSGKVLNKQDIEELSNIPSREVLLSMVAGILESPIQQVATALNAAAQELSYAFNGLIEKKEKEEETTEA